MIPGFNIPLCVAEFLKQDIISGPRIKPVQYAKNLFSALANNQIPGTEPPLQFFGNRFQHRISRGMTIGIIDAFKVVYIKGKDAYTLRLLCPALSVFRTRSPRIYHGFNPLLAPITIIEAGERIHHRQFFQRCDRFQIFFMLFLQFLP